MAKTSRYFSIVGPTAVGKTDLAFWLAKKLLQEQEFSRVDIISADSRQVYQGLETLSGADIPRDFRLQVQSDPQLSYFSSPDDSIRLDGISIIKPDQEWSVAHFQQLAVKVIAQSEESNRLSIIVGGTGLYHQHLTNPDVLLRIPPNIQLRNELQELSVEDLQLLLARLNNEKLTNMNESDRANPRRLIRAIEIEKSQEKSREQESLALSQIDSQILDEPVVTLGITDATLRIQKRIEERVRSRFSDGAQTEVSQLMANYENWSLPAFSTTGVKELRAYLEDRISAEECLQHWALSEIQYAKRQQTWWKKRNITEWISIQHSDWKETAAKIVWEKLQIEA